jgi:predicted ATPase/class 3 adenylate cyclase/Tfp pilus assembly protein PilF
MVAEVSFGEWLKRRRSALGLTQEQLALQLNCSTSALRKFESEERRPSAEIVEQLAEVFKIPQDERKSFLRFARGDWQAISSGETNDAPWRVSPIHTEMQVEPSASKQNLPTGTVTFLFTDIEGSTKLWEGYPEAMKTAHARHESIIREVVAVHGGYTYKMIGDAFQVAFATAPEALAAALDAQRALHAEPWAETGPIRVRMALHTGVTEERGDDYVGPVLNRAARLLGVGHGGQVLLTQSTYDLVCDVLPHDVSLRDLGEHRLKDLIRPEHIYQLTPSDLPSDYPPLKNLGTFAHNLPAQVTSFIGREKELDEIIHLVAKNRLVTLAGSGGIGKTRLSLKAAQELLNAFPDGVWFIELAPLSDPALVPQAMVSTLGLIDQAGRSALNVLTDFLQTKRALLILDNCEHLIQACAQLTETLLRACPDLHIFDTSREALGVPGENTFSVPALSAPEIEQSFGIETLTKYEAVQLFVERARAALPGFVLTKNNAPAIAQLCHQLDGIPLALELAAARIKMMSLKEIVSHLNDRFHLLTGGARTALPRHQTLQAMIDWSHDLLSEPERVLLRRLSVFAGGWSLEAAESVCGNESIETREILDLLTQLLNKSLILAEHKQGQETRYRMLETIRQYAREKLWAVREGEMMRQRHLAYFVDLSERAEPNLRSFDMVMWLDRLEAELDNIRAALEWALESDVEAQLRLASALLWFWHIRGHINEGVDWLERGLSIEAIERGDQPLTQSHALIRGKALNACGTLRGESLIGKSAERFEESLDLFKELGPAGKQGMGYALLGLAGWTEEMTKNTLQEQSLRLFREVGDKFGAAQCLMSIAGYIRVEGDYERAKAIGKEHLALRREIGDKDGIAIAHAHLGIIALRQGDYQQAGELYEESLAGFREVGNKWGIGLALSWLGGVAWEQGNHEQATSILEEALALGQNLGEKSFIAIRLDDLGKVAWAQGDYERATQKFEAALVFSREAGNKFEMSSALQGLGRVAQSQGDYATARSLYTEAIVICQETGNRWMPAFNLEAFAILAAAQKQLEPSPLRFEGLRRAARLFGAAETLLPAIRLEMPPAERAEHDQAIVTARAALGEEAFAAAWEEGKAMTMEQAVEYALEEG